MNYQLVSNVGFAVIGIIFGRMAYNNIFIHKSKSDYRSKWSLT